MKLRVLIPSGVLLAADVTRVSVEADDGAMTLLPRHQDFTTVLVPGLLGYVAPGGDERFLAVGDGVLVKRGDEVFVSVRQGVRGEELGSLREAVAEEFTKRSEREETARRALRKIEATFLDRFIELEHGQQP